MQVPHYRKASGPQNDPVFYDTSLHNSRRKTGGRRKRKGKTLHSTEMGDVKSEHMKEGIKEDDTKKKKAVLVASRCSEVCDILIVDVYRLLGGNVCAC